MTTKPSEPQWHFSFGDSLQAIICISELTIQNPFFMASEKAFQIGRPNSVFILIFFFSFGHRSREKFFFFCALCWDIKNFGERSIVGRGNIEWWGYRFKSGE